MSHLQIIRLLGPRWALWRAGYALRKASGLIKRRFPTPAWDEVRLQDLLREGIPSDPQEYRAWREKCEARFFFPPGSPPERALLERMIGEADRRRTIQIADDSCRGRFLYFSRHIFDLGWPPDWLLNPISKTRHENTTHWCDYPTFSPGLGDVKEVWEPSRFACAYWLLRAYALTGDEKYPRGFWELFDSWREQNPPNRGPNYKCGQETAVRLFSWCFALYGFWRSPATTPRRVARMVEAIAFQAARIAGNIRYAISQKNNHGISEAAGLMTAGLLFPELRGAARWLASGRRWFEREIRRQVYGDGSFVQHSMNYHRVLLHDCLWVLRLSELNGLPIAVDVTSLAAKAADFLLHMLDSESGHVPNYGANDGALFLPLTACDYRDYRPTVQAAGYLAARKRNLPDGPWDEAPAWLFAKEALAAPFIEKAPASRRFDAGGYYTLRGARSWCLIRCHAYRDRPAHVDMLHMDLWHRGVNVLGDSGTYKYFNPESPALDRYFKDIAAHNCVEIDGSGPLELFSRFLWLPWPGARCLEHGPTRFVGEHDGYDRPPWRAIHRREVRLLEDGVWSVLDEIQGSGSHELTLRWHLADGPCELDHERRELIVQLPCGPVALTIDGPDGLRMAVHRGGDQAGQVGGWTSHYYAEKSPRPTLEVRASVLLPARFVTRIGLPGVPAR